LTAISADGGYQWSQSDQIEVNENLTDRGHSIPGSDLLIIVNLINVDNYTKFRVM